jgi:hypothetical protein
MSLEHIGRLHILVIDRIMFAHKSQRRLAVEALPLAPYFLMGFRQQRDRFASAIAALLTSAHAALRSFERLFGFAIPARMKDACPSSERGERLAAEVNSGLLSSRWQ